MAEKIKVLFICVHNSARSQMAEAFVNSLDPEHFIAESAGLEPGKINPLVVEVMADEGINISKNRTKSVTDMISAGKQYDYVIAVCDGANAERCPVFPGAGRKINWDFDDPSLLSGSMESKIEAISVIRDEIKNKIENWIKSLGKQ